MTLMEINISNTESIQLVLNFLEKSFPESFHFWQFLNNIQRNVIKKDCLWSHQLFVNDQENIKCVLLIYSTIDFNVDYHLLTEEQKLRSRRVKFFCDSKDDYFLIPLIEQIIPWSKIKNITFATIEPRFSLTIENFIRNNNLGQCHIETFYRMELDEETFKTKTKENTYTHSSDIIIRPLSISDASTINGMWKYGSPWTLSQVEYEIEHFPTFGAYQNEELVGWSLTKYDGCIGSIFIKPESRGRGLATILNFYVTSKIFEQQQQKRAFCFIANDNIASLNIFKKLGYYRTCPVDWLVFSLK